ncbi:MAG: hypothetical protein ABI627_17420 [Polyangiaceae bacterium]
MSQATRLHLVASAFGAAAMMALASGCYAEAGAEPEYVDASAAPVDIELAPHYQYGGRTVYYVNDHWYARDRGNWVYYRKEPQPLYRQRHYVQSAPRAAHPRREARPRVETRGNEAPRARRVQ